MMGELSDISILDRFKELNEAVAEIRQGQVRLETQFMAISGNMARCVDHSERLRKCEMGVDRLGTTNKVLVGVAAVAIPAIALLTQWLMAM